MRRLLMVSVLFLLAMLTGSVAAADNATCEVGVLVSYQYSDDNGRINPTLEITDSGTGIEYNRTYDPSSGYTKLIFQHSNLSAANLTLTVRAPGYVTVERRLNLTPNPMDPQDTGYYASINLVLTTLHQSWGMMPSPSQALQMHGQLEHPRICSNRQHSMDTCAWVP